MNVHSNLYEHNGGDRRPLRSLSNRRVNLRAVQPSRASGVKRNGHVYFSGGLHPNGFVLGACGVEQEDMEINVIIAIAGIFGTGIAAWVAVKVGQAEQRRDISNLTGRVDYLSRKIERLEEPYFRPRRRHGVDEEE